MKKKLLAVLLSASMVVALAACGGGAAGGAASDDAAAEETTEAAEEAEAPAEEAAESTGEKITVILPQHEMDTIGLHAEKTEQFTAETGIEVELINMAWEQVADAITTDLTAGGNTYDVIEFDNAWVP